MVRLDVWSRGRKIMRQNDIFTRYVKNSSPILDTSLSWPSSSDFSPVKLLFILLSYLATIHCISLCLRKTKLCLFPSYIEFRIRLLVSMKYSTLVLIKTTQKSVDQDEKQVWYPNNIESTSRWKKNTILLI